MRSSDDEFGVFGEISKLLVDLGSRHALHVDAMERDLGGVAQASLDGQQGLYLDVTTFAGPSGWDNLPIAGLLQ